MFKKSNTKATVHFHQSTEGSSRSSTTIPLNDGNLLKLLKEQSDRYGELVINFINAKNEIYLTTPKTVDYENSEDRIDEIGNLIRDYIKNRAIPMEAHAVFSDGTLKGVFGKESLAQLKRKNLISNGASKDSIEIKPIQVDSFKNFE